MNLLLLLQSAPRAPMFFDGWYSIGRTAVLAAITYVLLIMLIRLAGKRAMAKMNVYDFVTIIVIGSALATAILSSEVVLADGLAALVTLLGLQYAISWATTRSGRIERIINGNPALLVYRGRLLDDQLKTERVSPEEIHAAIRDNGVGDISDVECLVLETDGTFTVIERDNAGDRSSLQDVKGFPDEKAKAQSATP